MMAGIVPEAIHAAMIMPTSIRMAMAIWMRPRASNMPSCNSAQEYPMGRHMMAARARAASSGRTGGRTPTQTVP